MTISEGIAFKLKLREYCIGVLESRLPTAEQLMARAQQSANEEGKSSAGDKYETSRAMGHLEKEMYQQQASNMRTDLSAAKSIDVNKHCFEVVRGSLIQAGSLYIFVCAGIGKRKIDNLSIFFISESAPLYKSLHQKKPGDRFILNQANVIIDNIW